MKFQLVLLVLIISVSVLAAETPLSIPSDPKAQFFVLEKGGSPCGGLRWDSFVTPTYGLNYVPVEVKL